MVTLVTGGTGFVGSHLVERLVERGDEVRAVIRPGRTAPKWLIHPRISLVQVNLVDRNALAATLDGVETVYHVAGAIKATSAEAFHQANAETTRSLLAAARGKGTIRRFVLVSSQAVAGPSQPHPEAPGLHVPVTEDDGYAPLSTYGQSKLAAEVIARRFREDVPLTIVRPTTVYGPRDSASLPFFQLARFGLRLGLAEHRVISLVHIADLLDGLLLAGEREVPSGRSYFLSGPEDASLRELMAVIGRVSARPGIWIPAPDRVVRAAGDIAGMFSALTGRAEVFGPEKAQEIIAPGWRCDISRARRELGYNPRVLLTDGIAQTAAWYRERGWVR